MNNRMCLFSSIIHYHKDRQTNTGRIEPSGEQGETNPGYDSYQTEKRVCSCKCILNFIALILCTITYLSYQAVLAVNIHVSVSVILACLDKLCTAGGGGPKQRLSRQATVNHDEK